VFHLAKSILTLDSRAEAGGWNIRQPSVKTNGLRYKQFVELFGLPRRRRKNASATGSPLSASTENRWWPLARPMSSSTVADHQQELQGYGTSKGTIRFPVDKPIPAALVRTLVKARIAEQKARANGNRSR
jgi:hypothetical protein